MNIIQPRIISLDSSTLGKLADDFYSRDSVRHGKALAALDSLRNSMHYVAITFTHLSELACYDNEKVLRNRISFLRQLPFVAWLRNYDERRQDVPGSIVCIHKREIQAFLDNGLIEWKQITNAVRELTWLTGQGKDIIHDDMTQWSCFAELARQSFQSSMQVASIAHAGPPIPYDTKLKDLVRLPRRSSEEMQRFASEDLNSHMARELTKSGDQRLEDTSELADEFAQQTLSNLDAMTLPDPFSIAKSKGIPSEFMRDEMTLRDVGELGVLAQTLKTVGDGMRPPRSLTLTDLPPDTLPSLSTTRQLHAMQLSQVRAKSSDLGDQCLAAMLLYADVVEVDKRTLHFVDILADKNSRFSSIWCQRFKLADYSALEESIC